MVNQVLVKKVEQTTNPLPPELAAVLVIFNADDELRAKALPFVNVEKREIDWNGIFKNGFGSGHRAACVWAKSLWTDQAPAKVDPFDRAFSMNAPLKAAVLNALAIRWGMGR